MTYMLAASTVLGTGLALYVLAGLRGWQPSLPAAIATGAALRGAVWFAAAAESWQPKDFRLDFPAAAAAVLHHHDPLLSGRPRGWPFLPTMAFVMAAELKLGQLAHLPWRAVGRLAPVAADLVLIPLVGRLAGERGPLRRFQYACNPLTIMICAIHGQLEPEILALAVAAFVLARSCRAAVAGILAGLAISIGLWALLLLPGVLLSLPDWRKRVRATCWAAAMPVALLVTSPLTVGTPVGRLPAVAHRLVGLRSVVGNWGWTTFVTHGRTEFLGSVGRPGALALALALLAAGFLWRRADPVDLTSALLITFLLVSPRVSVQYLAWPVPFLIARSTTFTAPAVIAASVWSGLGYLALGPRRTPSWVHGYMLAFSSWAVIPLLVLAMPWRRRRGDAGPSAGMDAGPVTGAPRTATDAAPSWGAAPSADPPPEAAVGSGERPRRPAPPPVPDGGQ
jgi:hypothetical protein